MNKVDQAVNMFEEGYSCSQAICSTYGEQFGLDRDVALKITSGFGGGIARRGEICGAVSGAIIVIGLKYGLTDADDKEAKEKTYEMIKLFIQKFEDSNESIVCKDLLGYNINTPEGLEYVNEKGLTKIICPNLVKNAAEILETIIEK